MASSADFVRHVGRRPAIQAPAWGRRLHKLRTSKGWTLAELSRRSGLSTSRLSEIEQDKNTNLALDGLLSLQAALELDTMEALLDLAPSAAAIEKQTERKSSAAG